MYSMTASKVIQQADEAEEFEQNPQYYHRNIDPAQVNFQIQFISKDVNSFISKLKNNTSFEKCLLKSENLNDNIPQKAKRKYYHNLKPKSEIDQISTNTQSLIEDLSWMNSINNIQRKSSTRKNDQSSIEFGTQTSFMHPNQSHLKRTYDIKSSQKFPPEPYSIENLKNNSMSVNVAKTKFQRASKNDFPKAIDIFKKSYPNFNLPQNPQIIKANKIYFDNNKRNQFLQEFDDKDTVVNQPQLNKKRKYIKTKEKSELKKKNVKDQSVEKLSKQKLLEKILKLQNSFEQLKSQQFKNKNMYFRQNQGLFCEPDIKSKYSFLQEDQLRVNPKVGRKYTIDQKSLKTKNTLMPSNKNTLNHVQEVGSFKESVFKPSKKQSIISTSHRKMSRSKIGDDSKISLSKWASEVWEDL